MKISDQVLLISALFMGETVFWFFSGGSSWILRVLIVILLPVLMLSFLLGVEFLGVLVGFEGKSALAGNESKKLAKAGVTVFFYLASTIFLGLGISPGAESSSNARGDLEKKIKQWGLAKKSLDETAAKFNIDRVDLAERLQARELDGPQTLEKDPSASKLFEEYLEIFRQLELLKKKDGQLIQAITGAESLLRRMDRQKDLQASGINEEDYKQFLEKALLIEDNAMGKDDPKAAFSKIERDGILKELIEQKLK